MADTKKTCIVIKKKNHINVTLEYKLHFQREEQTFSLKKKKIGGEKL